MTKRGVFITLEGTEGCGKTTLAAALAQHLVSLGKNPVMLREPGGTQLGESLRSMLKQTDVELDSPDIELLLFFASRLQLAGKRILPSLAAGKWVLCDRYIDSSWVYQVMAGGAGQELFDALIRHLKIPMPDLTLLLDLDPEVGLKRIARGRPTGVSDRFEDRGKAFLKSVCSGYRSRAERFPERIKRIAADASEQSVYRKAIELIAPLIEDKD